MPRQSHRHHKPHGSRHRKKDKRAASITTQQSEESEAASSSHGNRHHYTTPSMLIVNLFSGLYNSCSHTCTCRQRLLPKRSMLLIFLTWLMITALQGKIDRQLMTQLATGTSLHDGFLCNVFCESECPAIKRHYICKGSIADLFTLYAIN